MNEVETAPNPEEKHVWVQPRVIRPTKPKKAPAVSYMSEWGSALCLPCQPPPKVAISLGGGCRGGELVGGEVSKLTNSGDGGWGGRGEACKSTICCPFKSTH